MIRLALILLVACGSIAGAGERQKPAASSFRLRFVELAKDPAHGDAITHGSFREAWVGLRLERTGGLVGPIKRDPTGAAEFIDRNGTSWDVKGFHSEQPKEYGGFVLALALEKIEGEIAAGQHVILDDHSLSAADARLLANAIARKPWRTSIVWYRSR